MQTKQTSGLFILLLLGMLTAFGPLITDMYLPTLPEMVGAFSTTPSLVQLGLTASMVGLAVGQLFFGPMSDSLGRRRPLLAGMALFLVATLGCLFSQSILAFVGWRLLQGVAGASGIVIARSVATDYFTGRELARTMGLIGAINGVAPIAAPVAGGVLAGVVGWKGIFWCLFGLGVVLTAACCHFRESLPRVRRQPMKLRVVAHGFATVLHHRRYLLNVLQFSFCHVVLFANIASAPFIMQQHFGFSPLGFSVCFGVNASAIVLSSAQTMRFRHLEVTAWRGSQAMLAVAVLLLAALSLSCPFWVYEVLLLALLLTLGFTFTAANTLAMAAERANAGTASAVMGALGFLFGGLVPPLVGLGNILVTTGLLFVAGALGVCVCATCSLRYLLNRRVAVCRA